VVFDAEPSFGVPPPEKCIFEKCLMLKSETMTVRISVSREPDTE